MADKLHFFTLPYCQIFNLSMYSIVISNHSRQLDYTKIIQTEVGGNFTLSNYSLTIQDSEVDPEKYPNGLAEIEWTHSYQCVQKYMLRLRHSNPTKGEIKGEIVIPSPPRLNEKIKQNLNSILGKNYL